MTYTLQQSEDGNQFINIPEDVINNRIGNDTSQRVKCELNDKISFLSNLSIKEDGHFIRIGEKISESLNVHPGDNLSVILTREIKSFHFPMPDILSEVLSLLPEVKDLFSRLTEGRKRTYQQLINDTTSLTLKWERSREIARQLKMGYFNPWEVVENRA